MSWPVWTPPVVGLPNYTAEQWAAVQQQNWQQWAQWQEQYNQWQVQYGDKYSEQMLTLQANAAAQGTQPPLPPTPSDSRPPPPPDGPPPSKQEEEKISAYAAYAASVQPVETHAAKKNQQNPFAAAIQANLYSTPGIAPLMSLKTSMPTLNSAGKPQSSFSDQRDAQKRKHTADTEYKNYAEAINWTEEGSLKDLTTRSAEYAYSKSSFVPADANWYNQVQANSNSNGTYTAQQIASIQNPALYPNFQNQPLFPSVQSQNVAANAAISEEERQFDIQFKKWEEEFETWKQQNINHPDKVAYQEYEKKFQTCRLQLMERKEQMRAKRLATMMTQLPPIVNMNNMTVQRNMTNPMHYDQTQNSYDANDPSLKKDGSTNFLSENSNFLKKSQNAKGIPGLDLVDESRRAAPNRNASDIVDITESEADQNRKPDLKAISKGINNILGDQKLLDMLSMVAQNKNIANPYSIEDNQDKELPAKRSRWADDSETKNHMELKAYSNADMNYNSDIPGTSALNYNRASFNPSQTATQMEYDAYQSDQPLSAAAYQQNMFQMAQSFDQDKQIDYYNNAQYDGNNRDFRRHSQYEDGNRQGFNYEGNSRDSRQFPLYDDSNRDAAQNEMMAPAQPQWMDFPILEPATIVDYQHKSIKTGIDFLEPVQTFDYGHMSSDKNFKDKNSQMWMEMDVYQKKSGAKINDYQNDKLNADYANADYPQPRYNDRYRDDNDRFRRNDRNRDYDRRDDFGKDRDFDKKDDPSRDKDFDRRDDRNRNDRNRFRDRSREKRDRFDNRNDSRDKSLRKSIESTSPNANAKADDEAKDVSLVNVNRDVKNIVMIDDILESPGREVRPDKIVIVLRGLPGSGKSYLAKLIKDREVENGGSAPRILSMDDYFICESEATVEDPETGRVTKKREMKYEYDGSMEEIYITSLQKAFKRTLSDGFFPFIIVDSVNDQFKHFSEMEVAGRQFNFKMYVCEMDVDVQTCFKRNLHERKIEDIEKLKKNWVQTPPRFTLLDATTLLQTAGIDHVQMEDVSDEEIQEEAPKDVAQNEEEEVQAPFSSKWDRMDDTDKLARLDGTSKPLRHTASTMEDFLQLDEWTTSKTAKPGKKTVRWADIEEHRQQEKMRAIGFVVGQTDWQRMTDPTQGSGALTQTKYIERVRKY